MVISMRITKTTVMATKAINSSDDNNDDDNDND